MRRFGSTNCLTPSLLNLAIRMLRSFNLTMFRMATYVTSTGIHMKITTMCLREVFISFIYFLYVLGAMEKDKGVTLDVDYSGLAGEAELNKNDILNFLNTTRVRELYKTQYERLLATLNDNGTDKSGRREKYERTGYNYLDKPSALDIETRRIVAGRNTSIAAVPWQVSLREKTYPICGGSIVTDLWILTAAHCLLRARSSDLSVRLGSSWKTFGGEMYDVRECFVHPRYVSKSKVNDVGLVGLYSPLRFSPRVLPIRMVARDTRLPSQQPAIVSGWGKLKEGGASATFLQSSTIKTIAMKLCKRSGLDRKAIDPASMFCAGSFSQNSPDACQGDSGGPIVREGVLIGVVSWGLGCARGNFPGVYTRLAYPVIWDWVMGHITRTDKSEKASL